MRKGFEWVIASVPIAVFEQYEKVRLTGKVNMFDYEKVLSVAITMELQKLVDFIAWKRENYVRILEHYTEWINLTARR